MMFDPPDGFDDLDGQCQQIETGSRWGEIEVAGRPLRVKRPTPVALNVFTKAISKHSPKGVQDDMTVLFVRQHLDDDDYEGLMVRMMDPDDDFTLSHFGEVMRGIATLGTARPTVPLRT